MQRVLQLDTLKQAEEEEEPGTKSFKGKMSNKI